MRPRHWVGIVCCIVILQMMVYWFLSRDVRFLAASLGALGMLIVLFA